MKDTVEQPAVMKTIPVQNLDTNKLRGGYYTPSALADWVSTWCVRDSGETVLEPSCGDGHFLLAAALRLKELGASPEAISKQLQGIEIIDVEAESTVRTLRSSLELSTDPSVVIGDFFEWWKKPGRGRFDAVVGNPPFIRYQSFPDPYRTNAMEVMRRLGLRPNKLTNSWVPFVAAASRALKPGGRMGLVLPAELLQVSYAAQLRTFLVENFIAVHVVACNELFFDNAEQEVVVLLAEGALAESDSSNICKVSISSSSTRDAVLGKAASLVIASTPPKVVQHHDEKWLKYFLSQKQIDLLRSLRSSGVATTLDQFATVDVGVVTGRNEFFVVSDSQVREWGLQRYVLPIAARAAHFQGAIFSQDSWDALDAKDERVHLVQLGSTPRAELPANALRYVENGERQSFHLGYKCSIRTPWYLVPSVWAPDLFLFRQIYDFPRVLLNDARASCTDTIHRMRVHNGTPEVIAAMCFTSLSAASAEIEGRSYGGGVLELEPTEAERLLVPGSISTGLSIHEIDSMVRDGRISEVLSINDERVLGGQMGLSLSDRELLSDAWVIMRERRHTRRRVRPVGRGRS